MKAIVVAASFTLALPILALQSSWTDRTVEEAPPAPPVSRCDVYGCGSNGTRMTGLAMEIDGPVTAIVLATGETTGQRPLDLLSR